MKYENLKLIVVVFCALLWANPTLQAQDTDSYRSRSVRSYGLAVPAKQVTLRSAVDGQIAEVLVEEGQLVKKGETVAQLKCRSALANVKIAKLESEATGNLENANAEYEAALASFKRHKSLHRQNVATSREYSEANLRLKRAQAALKIENERLESSRARLEVAEAELEQYSLNAPFDGQVVRIETGPGASVTQTEDLIQIVSLNEFRVDLYLPVSEANELKVGSTIPVQVTSPFKRTIEAKIAFRSPLIEAATRTTRVSLIINNRNLDLPSGFMVSIVKDNPVKTIGYKE